ncbi:DUF29 domain-containing protein [uncultured Enterovirga sp.]|uniref:DUF29 domain-containing protein n=1 Tax=uncultured Enterovirga sp. TaxID=2026352 RepID=UPI0035CA89F7
MDFATLYEEDIETWAEIQVAALRRLAAIPGPWSNVIDWENVIEEIDDLSSDRKAAESLLRNAFAHLLKAAADPDSLAVRRWRVDTSDFLDQARVKLKNSMRQRLDLDRVWMDARDAATNSLKEYDRALPPDIPRSCPFSFDDIRALDPDVDLTALLLRRRRP